MKRIIEILRKNELVCFPNERFSLGVEMFPENGFEYKFPEHVRFEDPGLKNGRKIIPGTSRSLFRYFLDGSQRSYRVIDASFEKRYLPICAGQIGVAVLERMDDNNLAVRRDLTEIENILAIPSLVEKDNAKDIENKINQEIDPKFQFRIVRYDYSKEEDVDPGDKGRAMIIHEMQILELKKIREMIDRNLLKPDRMLVKDGGLQYRTSKMKNLNFNEEDLVQFRNVIGLAKTFNPNITLGKGRSREDLGNLVKDLEKQERSTVVCTRKDELTTQGWWYLRLRPKDKLYNPLQGIVKIEVFATGQEKEKGIPEERADTISGYVYLERNVTPFNADKRWASHIYPIYLTETYLKSSFLSHNRFKALIF